MQMLESAVDGSGYIVQVDVTDETGEVAVPASASWTLTDGSDTVINSRSDVAIVSPASTMYISLGSDDLDAEDGRMRHLAVTATYISSLTGLTEDLKQCTRFIVAGC